ncbi:MAG: DUF4390 domain-containing protein [Chromatiales bacterium]|nr:DUF4390 domain-containing protein [Chromatiales bacterium]
MNDSLPISLPWLRRCRRALALCCLALVPLSLPGQTPEGSLEVRNASARLVNGVYYASARIEYRLSADAIEAMENGVPLTFELQVEISRVRRFWANATVATLRQSYQLSYQPLSQLWLVRNLNSGEQRAFTTLFAAVSDMGRVSDLPLIDAALLEPNQTYIVWLRVVLDQQQLPGPLRLLAFWRDGFSLESEWYQWTLRD